MRARMMLAIVVAAAVITAACGDSKSSLLPTAPSGLAAAPNVVDASTTASGTMGNGPKPGNGNGNGPAPGATTETTTKVEFEGPIDAVNPDGSIVVDGQLIGIVPGHTVIRKGDRDVPQSELKKGDRVHVSANKTGTVVVATEIKLQNPCSTCVVEPPPPPPVVSVTALDAEAVEGGTNTGTFRLSRTGTPTQLLASLSVSFTLGGTATTGDYAPITSIVFQGGATVDVVVTAQTDSANEGAETVDLTLTSGAGYVVGTPASATVTIRDPLPQVSITAPDSDAGEAGENGGRFEVARNGDTSVPLTVTLEFSGTALLDGPDPDYIVMSHTPSGSTVTFTFTPGQVAVLVFVMPLNDPHTEDQETIVLTVVDGADYDRGAQFSATVFIAPSDQ